MALIVADTSSLISLGTVMEEQKNPLDVLLNEHQVYIPKQVSSEITDIASFTDHAAYAAQTVLDRSSEFNILATDLDEDFPLDDGENAAVRLANELDATQLLCDEFNHLALIHASMVNTRLVTTPTLLIAFVHNEYLSPKEAMYLLNLISDARSWTNNSYVAQAKLTLERHE